MTRSKPKAGHSGPTNDNARGADLDGYRSDDELRRFAAAQLADNLQIGVDLAERCGALSRSTEDDRIGPIYAAARMMQANARIAQALANLAQVEGRRRSIVEHIQPPDPKLLELNSQLHRKKRDDEHRRELERRLQAIVDRRPYQPSPADEDDGDDDAEAARDRA